MVHNPASMTAEYADLMERYVRGDAQAFDQLYTAVGPQLLRYLVRLARDLAVAEDLLQLTFLKVHRARDAYVLGAAPLPWLYAIAHRTFLDEARRKKRARVRVATTADLPEREATITGDDARTAPVPVDRERLGQVLAAMDELPATQKQALLLTKLEGRSIAEAARIAGTTAGAMKLRAHRAYQAIRKRLLPVGAS